MVEVLRPVMVLMRREVRDQFRDWRIIIPIVILTLFFPVLMNFTAEQIVGFVRSYGGQGLLSERLIPFLLMVVGFFPTTVSLVIALESFAGETERRSIEPLLSSPLADWQLYLGKLLASTITPLFASYLGVTVYLVGVYFSVDFRPDPVLVVQLLLLAAVEAVVMVSGAVVVSTQTTSVRAANLLSSFIIIPMALLVQAESVVMLWGQYEVLWLAILGQIVLAGLLIRTGIAHFSREELLGREMDEINLKWGWHIFKTTFVGQARSFGEWYRTEVFGGLKTMGLPILVASLLLLVGVVLGQWLVYTNSTSWSNIDQYLTKLKQGAGLGIWGEGGVGLSAATALFIWLNNLKSVALISLLGLCSFGVLGMLGLMVTPAVVGGMAALVSRVGMSPLLFLTAYILPHGLVEVPAIVLAGATILRMGTTLVTPAQGQTVGEAWLRSLADWAKIMLALVIPLFFIAALIEVFVTPAVGAMLLAR
jgi:uncharacterized membrane protein SpoIIM required for sporulation/ABC-type transport system involved in multi-copper enzyme maturation permease subunit